ncbi:MAG: hypothetical protein V7K90_16240 [Nostoc sp.]|uniref:hypothetical protein n=1 Tax=Nostoc sp. TaxID=1180 RepID=UPI002FF9CAFB
MDNKPLEIQAESIIQHKLVKDGFLVTKPSFDKEGSDLLIIENISQRITPFIKVQCKGRTIKKNSNVTIPTRYVEENFVVFLYVEEYETKNDFIYVFFQDDIKSWRTKGSDFQLIIPKDFQHRADFLERVYSKEARLKIENLLLRQTINQLIKTNYSVIIDGIFLEKAVVQTRKIYKRIYSEKTLCKPNIDAIVEQLLKDAHIKRKEEVNCYLIYSTHFNLQAVVDICEVEEDGLFMDDNSSLVGYNCNLFKLKTQDFILFKVVEQLERIINVESVFLVADDVGYNPYLQDLKDRGVEVIVFQNSENSGSRMFHNFNWADISNPLALAMGLNQDEL